MAGKEGIEAVSDAGHVAEQAWLRYYEDWSGHPQLMLKEVALMSNQRSMLRELSNEISGLLKHKRIVSLWSAGSGVDRISLELKSQFGESLELTIEDISAECMAMNRELFARRGLTAEFIVGDLFEAKPEGRFDIVANSGLLEHFGLEEQKRLMSIFQANLKPGGLYLTVTPSRSAWIFEFLRRKAVERNRWPYGPEAPVATLGGLSVPGLELFSERRVGALDQLLLVEIAYPALWKAMRPVVALARRAPLAVDRPLCRAIGGYCILSKFRKAA